MGTTTVLFERSVYYMDKKTVKLFDSELKIMDILWKEGDGEIMKEFPKVGNGEENQAACASLCLMQVVFEDGTIWNNPDYEKWFETYAGKETDTDRPQNYYPHEYRIESD